jgi:hypothetical protein
MLMTEIHFTEAMHVAITIIHFTKQKEYLLNISVENPKKETRVIRVSFLNIL